MSGMTRDGPTCPASVGAVVRVARSAGRRRPWTPPSASASASPDPDPDPDPDPERPAPACAGRATVATVSAAAGTAHVLWEPRVPRPVPAGWVEGEVGGEVGVRRRGAPTPRLPGREFLVAPLLGGRGGRIADVMEEEEEEEVPLRSLSALDPYEVDLARLRSAGAETGLASAPAPASAEAWKARGDALLRLGDCVAAIEAYEASLRAGGGARPELGGTVVVERGGRPTLAEVDCLEAEEGEGGKAGAGAGAGAGPGGTADVTLVEGAEDGQEATVGLGEVLLCLPGGGAAAVGLQERVLLNLARCLLRIADPAEDPAGVPPPPSSLRAGHLPEGRRPGLLPGPGMREAPGRDRRLRRRLRRRRRRRRRWRWQRRGRPNHRGEGAPDPLGGLPRPRPAEARLRGRQARPRPPPPGERGGGTAAGEGPAGGPAEEEDGPAARQGRLRLGEGRDRGRGGGGDGGGGGGGRGLGSTPIADGIPLCVGRVPAPPRLPLCVRHRSRRGLDGRPRRPDRARAHNFRVGCGSLAALAGSALTRSARVH